MLPLVVANEMQEAVRAFLRSAFPIATRWFQTGGDVAGDPHRLINDLVERDGAIFRGPYLDLKLPFRRAGGAELPFRHVRLRFEPFQHQYRAFARLTGDAPRSTVIATGTGSGKTECFMLPLLDDCLHRRERGIKALVIYPMNALATDQAKRFAAEVAELDTRLTVGLYVGGQQATASDSMGPEQVITDRAALRKNPPDILLTNYKMLDFLLIRPVDQPLWRYNTPGMLRYLVVDELHTFDGAQGTDLACLIRRLRDRLEAGPELACVGTSATIGKDSPEALLQYASEVFAAPFDGDALVDEDRLSADEYLTGDRVDGEAGFNWPTDRLDDLEPSLYHSNGDYLFHQARLWFDGRKLDKLQGLTAAADSRAHAESAVVLGAMLRSHVAFHELVQTATGLVDTRELGRRWRDRLHLDAPRQANALLASLLSLVSSAREWDDKGSDHPDKWCKPFLQVGVQLWLRELRRMVCSVPAKNETPRLAFDDDDLSADRPLHLPLLHCRECHLAGWGAVTKQGDVHLDDDLQRFYQAWFQLRPEATLLVPLLEERANQRESVKAFCPHCIRLQTWPRKAQNSQDWDASARGKCSECDREALLPVWLPDMLHKPSGSAGLELRHDCPECGARDGMMVVGYRAATLTSVMVGRLNATPYNDDHKLIAFSDSVQDAAHRAGFLGANTWRQVVRQAMVGWLSEQARPLSLKDMAELLPGYWRQRLGHDGRFCGLFMPPNLAGEPDYERLRGGIKLPEASQLPGMVAKRLGWECVAEFGRRSRVGRSLERTGQAAIGIDPRRLQRDLDAVFAGLREQVEMLRGVPEPVLLQFVIGWLEHLRRIGAIHDSALDGYLVNKGREFLLNKIPWMPGFGRGKRPPAAVTLGHVTHNFEALVLGKRQSWSQRWFDKTLAAGPVLLSAETRTIFKALLDGLAGAGWLVERSAGGEAVYQLDPARLLVSGTVHRAICDACRHPVALAPGLAEYCHGMPCLRAHCTGRMQVVADSTKPSLDYGRTEPWRLVPHEHTGLLERDMREQVERSFTQGHEPWDINLLSATPTLEMGIDIGALSSVLLCSVPPTQANYLQRIGRAGRRDGNALAVTVANGRNHDLYFYADPMEMMAGAIQPPGVFLQARAVLERPLLAWCLGRWTASGIDASLLPDKLGKVLDAVEHGRTGQFPYNFLDFVAAHQASLLAEFFELFEDLRDQARAWLEGVLQGQAEGRGDGTRREAFSLRLVKRLQELVHERKDMAAKIRQLKARMDRLQQRPQDEATQQELLDTGRERSALQGLKAERNRQSVLNFFTDEGLLPNYAFPEEGVTLQSVILRRRSREQTKTDGSAWAKTPYSFQRPAQAALGELAPESRFYAISHELPIERVDLELSRPEEWRFCDRCQYSERVDIDDRHSACPRCGSGQWGDSGQKHTVLRLRQVYATVDDGASRIGDEAEQRQPRFFNRQMLVDIPPEGRAASYRLNSEQLPFGFEFLRRVLLREVNFGMAGGEAASFAVAGRELARRGFPVCRHCGTVQKERPRRNEPQHAWTCKLRQHPDKAEPEDFFRSLYLYRELESEAIRILLPLSEVAYSDEKKHSFIAALNLGLREYFHGDVHHLQVTDMHEPASKEGAEKAYLVVYDRIPGGTGYLKELMEEPDRLMEALACAYRRLTHCPCIDDGDSDGCYRCILAYRDSRNMPAISRRAAVELLAGVLALREQLEGVESLRAISTDPGIESDLERKFVEVLAALPGARVSGQLVNGRAGSLLTLPGADGRPVAWNVEHQIALGPTDGVALQTRVDVLLTPARSEDSLCCRPIAVYMDGLQYHHERVAADVCKRTALLASGRYWVYSLNWDDLPSAGRLAKPCDPDLLALPGCQQQAMRPLYDGLADTASWLSAVEAAERNRHGSMARLNTLLRAPATAESKERQAALLRGMTVLVPTAAKDATVLEKLGQQVLDCVPEPLQEAMAFRDGGLVPGGLTAALGNAPERLALLAALPVDATRQRPDAVIEALRVHLCFDDRDTTPNEGFKAAWRAFWHGANQLQFLPGFSIATRSAVADGTLADVLGKAERLRVPAKVPELASGPDQAAWAEVLELSLLEADAIEALAGLGLPVPGVGVDIAGPDGEILIGGDNVELCWRHAHVAVLNEPARDGVASWRLIVAAGDWVQQIQSCKAEGLL